MQTLNQETIDALNSPGREFETKVDFITWSAGIETVTNTLDSGKIIDWTVDESASSDGNVMIGAVTAAKLTLKIHDDTGALTINQRQKMRLYLRLKLGTEKYTEWIPLGAYYCDKTERKNRVLTVTAYDGMVLLDVEYNSYLTFPEYSNRVIKDIAGFIGFSFDENTPEFEIMQKPEGKTCRSILGQIASVNISNARLDRNGKFVLSRILGEPAEVSSEQIISYNFSQDSYSINKIIVKSKEAVYEYGSGNTMFSISNDILTKAQCDNKFTSPYFREFFTGNLELRGDLRLEPGDTITVSVPYLEGRKNYTTSIVDQQLYFNGGLKQTIRCNFPNEIQTETALDGGTLIKQGTSKGLNYAVFSKLPNVLPNLEDNTLICELNDIPGTVSTDSISSDSELISSTNDYTLYNLKNIYLYQKQPACFAHTDGLLNCYTEYAQTMEEIILPKKLRGYFTGLTSNNKDYRGLSDLWSIRISEDYYAPIQVYQGLAVCRKLTIPRSDSSSPVSINNIGDCPALEECTIYGSVSFPGSPPFYQCPSLYAVHLDCEINGTIFLPQIFAQSYVSEIYLRDDITYNAMPLSTDQMLASKLTLHTKALERLGLENGYPFFSGNMKEITLAEGTVGLFGNSFIDMPYLECVVFPSDTTYMFMGSGFESDGTGKPIFYNCPAMKKVKCRQSASSVQSFASSYGLEVEYIQG